MFFSTEFNSRFKSYSFDKSNLSYKRSSNRIEVNLSANLLGNKISTIIFKQFLNNLKKSIRHTIKFIYKNLEAFIWTGGLIYLASINPYADGHLQLCGFKAMGIDNCPGCGIGKSISMIFHGDISHSINSHPLGIIALVLIIYRIVTVLYKNYKVSKLLPEVYNG